MLEVRPTRENAIYLEWRKWRHECDKNYSAVSAAAKASIERIAEQEYSGKCACIVGVMIIMDDLQEMEAEQSSKESSG